MQVGGIIFSPVLLEGWCTAYYASKSGGDVLWERSAPAGGREGRCHTQNDPHVQFWDEKLEGRMGAGLLLGSGLCRHMAIIWSSFEHAASLLMKRAVVQHENRAAKDKGQFPPTAITKREAEGSNKQRRSQRHPSDQLFNKIDSQLLARNFKPPLMALLLTFKQNNNHSDLISSPLVQKNPLYKN